MICSMCIFLWRSPSKGSCDWLFLNWYLEDLIKLQIKQCFFFNMWNTCKLEVDFVRSTCFWGGQPQWHGVAVASQTMAGAERRSTSTSKACWFLFLIMVIICLSFNLCTMCLNWTHEWMALTVCCSYFIFASSDALVRHNNNLLASCSLIWFWER